MRTSIAARANLELLEENYRRWQQNPESVDSGWSAFFEGFELGNLPQRNGATAKREETRESPLQTRIDGLVYAYRTLGHTIARVNPLAEKRPENPLLTLRELGFSEKDLDLRVSSKFFLDNRSEVTPREMAIALLEQIMQSQWGRVRPPNPPVQTRNSSAERLLSGQVGDTARGAGQFAPRFARSGILRDFSSHSLCRPETVFSARRGIVDGDPRLRLAKVPRRRGGGNHPQAWRTAAA